MGRCAGLLIHQNQKGVPTRAAHKGYKTSGRGTKTLPHASPPFTSFAQLMPTCMHGPRRLYNLESPHGKNVAHQEAPHDLEYMTFLLLGVMSHGRSKETPVESPLQGLTSQLDAEVGGLERPGVNGQPTGDTASETDARPDQCAKGTGPASHRTRSTVGRVHKGSP